MSRPMNYFRIRRIRTVKGEFRFADDRVRLCGERLLGFLNFLVRAVCLVVRGSGDNARLLEKKREHLVWVI